MMTETPINFGYELQYRFIEPTSMRLMLHLHSSHLHALLRADDMRVEPFVHARIYHDAFGNTCTRVEAPAGPLDISANGWLDPASLDAAIHPFAKEHPLSLLPDEALLYLRPSTLCDVDPIRDGAARAFAGVQGGWTRVKAISHFVRRQWESAASPSQWQSQTHRDALHRAIALCRAMNIPARYCMGYRMADDAVMAPADFAAWFEAYLGGNWQAFDPWDDSSPVFRLAIAHGRDAGDVPVCTTFGPGSLLSARVWARRLPMPVERRATPSSSNFLSERFGELSSSDR